MDEHSQTNNQREEKKLNLETLYHGFVVLSLIVIILLIIFKPCNCHCHCKGNSETTPEPTEAVTPIKDDDNLSNDKNTATISSEDLNKMVEDGMITISMNADPVFEDGKSKGNLNIENDKSNKRPQFIQIYLKDSNRLVYTSGKIPVGKYIISAPLDVELKAGNYTAVAYFNALDENNRIVGTAGAEITLHILH